MKALGEIIRDELREQERPITWFARKLCLDRSNVYRLFQKNSIDTDLLMRISRVLNRDFFALLSQELASKQRTQQ
ncbi:MAG: XRE family transcriptional regulator [Muribaculaceae bacterium]|nr:XRE family transcriptional regulator [Muribaculaceae bacterium]